MSSAEARLIDERLIDDLAIEISESDLVDVNKAIEKWHNFPSSVISDHDAQCCRIAKEWLAATDFSQLNHGDPLTGPRWLRSRYAWGPSTWSIHWCEAVEKKTLDCGALAAIAHKIFTSRGAQSYPAQFIHRYAGHAAHHWHDMWTAEDTSVHWIDEDLIYHEGCAVVVRDREIRLWDPTASWWVNPKQFGGYGEVLAVRVFVPQADAHTDFNWGTHRISPNEWQRIARARGDFIERV